MRIPFGTNLFSITLSVTCAISFSGCASTAMTTMIRTLEKPVTLQATRSYLPPGVAGQPTYTIYEGSKWDCKNTTEKGDYVCCSREAFSSLSPWKYCLIVDNEYNAFGFFELGTSQYTTWSSGKQALFRQSRD